MCVCVCDLAEIVVVCIIYLNIMRSLELRLHNYITTFMLGLCDCPIHVAVINLVIITPFRS